MAYGDDMEDHTGIELNIYRTCTNTVLSEGYEHGGPGVCLGEGQTEAEVL